MTQTSLIKTCLMKTCVDKNMFDQHIFDQNISRKATCTFWPRQSGSRHRESGDWRWTNSFIKYFHILIKYLKGITNYEISTWNHHWWNILFELILWNIYSRNHQMLHCLDNFMFQVTKGKKILINKYANYIQDEAMKIKPN